MSSPAPQPDLPYDAAWARGVLAGDLAPPPPVIQEEVVEALVAELAARKAVDALSALAEQQPRALSKAARRGLHQLRSRGIAVSPPAPTIRPPSGTGRVTAPGTLPPAGVTPYDHTLQRVVLLAGEAMTGLNVFQARISALYGLVDFLAWASSRREYRQITDQVSERVAVVKVPHEQALWLVIDAARRTQAAQRSLPEEYARARQVLGAAPEGPHPAEELPPAEATPEELTRLLELEELALWAPDQDTIHRLMLRVQEVATSRLIINDEQRQAQILQVVSREVDSHFTPERSAAYQRVLLDTAHLLAAAGRPEKAALARAGADVFALPHDQLVVHPLPQAFIERVVPLGSGPGPQGDERAPEPAPEEEHGGLILPGSTRLT